VRRIGPAIAQKGRKDMKTHAVVYSWPRVETQAVAIAGALSNHVHRVSIVQCTDYPVRSDNGVETFVLDNSCYFGEQFRKTLDVFDGDILLQVAADASTDDWGQLARQCEARFRSIPRLGIWAPDIEGTSWRNDRVVLYATDDPEIVGVGQTDVIVWGVRNEIVRYLRSLDYSATPLGWGIDWAAIAHAYANKFRVVRDLSVKIHHPTGTGYDRAEAHRQRNAFLGTLAEDEKVLLYLLLRAVGLADPA
jgi:hypothetical protein